MLSSRMVQQYPESSQATTALVLGILSLICLPILGPVAWVIANTEIRAIDEGRRDPTNRGTAVAGKVLGIIGTVLIALALLVFGFFFIAGSVVETVN